MTDRPTSGMYFEGDIEKSAAALIEMFGDEAPKRASERAAEYNSDSEGARFWNLMAEATRTQLAERAKE